MLADRLKNAGGGAGGASLVIGTRSNWTANSNTGTDSSDSITSNSTNHSNNSQGYVNYTVVGNGDLYYDCRVSSESNWDWLYFTKNGSDVFTRISGTVSRTGTISVSDGDALKFRYTKDGSVSRNADTGYIDDLYFV